jgi:hypothetical protein
VRFALDILPAAIADIEEAARWYEDQQEGLGAKFALEASAAIRSPRQGMEEAGLKSPAFQVTSLIARFVSLVTFCKMMLTFLRSSQLSRLVLFALFAANCGFQPYVPLSRLSRSSRLNLRFQLSTFSFQLLPLLPSVTSVPSCKMLQVSSLILCFLLFTFRSLTPDS